MSNLKDSSLHTMCAYGQEIINSSSNNFTNNNNTENKSNSKKRGRPKVTKIPDHIKKTESDSYYCSVCEKTFKSRSQQYYHFACANDINKKYKCKECERVFSTRSHLNYHMETHSLQVYNCFQCNKKFKNKLVLKKHEKIHTNNQTLKCTKCEKIFQNKESLRTHLDKHINNLRFPCNLCNNQYASKSILKQHMRNHSAKEHKCTQCDKYFQRKSSLKQHMNRHTKKDRLTCHICFKIFFEVDTLRRHSQLHKDVKKYKCTICNIISLRKDNMQRHLRNIHSVENSINCIEIVETCEPPSFSSEKCNEISKLNYECEHLNGNDEINLPKTIENSSVIKCIGNVEPVKIPNDVQQQNKLLIKKELNKTEKCDAKSSITHKKFKKKYDPIEMYRKILLPDDDGDADTKLPIDKRKANTERAQPIVKKVVEQHRSTFNNSNFSETHWRKNFKYTYEYQDY